jgi:DNA excision repair protein ERCC-3
LTHPDNPLIIQSDQTVLLEVNHPAYIPARDALARFAELEKSPEYIHTYRITPLSLWNAAAAGIGSDRILSDLETYSKYPLPTNLVRDIKDTVHRFGRVRLIRSGEHLLLESDDPLLITEISRQKHLQPYIEDARNAHQLQMNPARRGHIKQGLLRIGYPAEDLAGYITGESLPFQLRQTARSGKSFAVRAYQERASSVFYADGSARGGSGVIVLPCGAGKTIVGMAIMATLQTSTLILTPNTVAVRQWISELLDKTTLQENQIGEYTGLTKDIRPVTISTYQIITYRKRKKETGDDFPHFKLFNARNWGLIIYDEVHLLPAPVFRITAELQARRRLGLTATLIREDKLESDVFSLIGPKKFDVPWKDLEKQGWIATAICHEIRIPMAEEERMTYALAPNRQKYRVAAENPRKTAVLETLLRKHRGQNILIIGLYLDQLEALAAHIDAPLITGKTKVKERERLYEQFRQGEEKVLVISKVGNFSIDLPDANAAIEISGTFGSRQEEAQRLGRILRPKQDDSIAHFYTLVTHDTVDQTFANNRQRFLTEQGYQYHIEYEQEILKAA